MAQKALLTRRSQTAANNTNSIVSEGISDLNLTDGEAAPGGALIVELENEQQAAELEARGFRVKLLQQTDILEVGDYRINTDAASQNEENVALLKDIPAEMKMPPHPAESWSHHLVQLAGPPTEEWIRKIEARGVDVVEPISLYGLFVVGSTAVVQGLLELPFVSWVGQFKPEYRIAPELLEKKGRIRYVSVGVYPEKALPTVRSAIKRLGGRIKDDWGQRGSHRPDYGILIVEIAARKLKLVAEIPEVCWLEYQAPTLSSEDERSCQIVAESLDATTAPNTRPLLGYKTTLTKLGLSGQGVVVGICDTGVDTNVNSTLHPDLLGRLAFFVDVTGGITTTDVTGHGTQVAGIAVGDAASGAQDSEGFLLGQGIAPKALFGVVNPVDAKGGPGTDPIAVFTRHMVGNGAHVMNNSWAQNGSGGYTSNAALLDSLVRDPNHDNHVDPDRTYLVMVFSAGNQGAAGLTPPKEAKNPITVGNSISARPGNGALSDIRGIASNSSRGPAKDGRLLPTIVAPGTFIVSARTRANFSPLLPDLQRPLAPYIDAEHNLHEDHAILNGTSAAAPHVSGLCALLIEWWRKRTGGKNPSPAMVKALLVNGAEDLVGGPDGFGGQLRNIPNNNQGWGRVSLENIVLDFPDSDRGPKLLFDQESPLTTAGQEQLFRIRPDDASRPLRITLVWTDAPGTANSKPALRNDLDLEVTELETGNIFKGNVFANGFSVTGGQFDQLNNIECVYIQSPVGTYEVRIIAAAIKSNARPPFDNAAWQDFALVIDNAQEESNQ
ncbi:MAG TPA: S8 family serine peptidase [Pyrinomonadaceae bacterium]|jgi:hypothetical protein